VLAEVVEAEEDGREGEEHKVAHDHQHHHPKLAQPVHARRIRLKKP
jgi:hypothetical protein